MPESQSKTTTKELAKNLGAPEWNGPKLDPNAKIPEAEALPTENLTHGDAFLNAWNMPKYPGLQPLPGSDAGFADQYYNFAVKDSAEQVTQFYLHKFATIGCKYDEQNSYFESESAVIKCVHPKGTTKPIVFTIIISPPEAVKDPKYKDGRTYLLMHRGNS